MFWERLLSLKNQRDFTLRQMLTISLPIKNPDEIYERDKALQRELQEFLQSFAWTLHKNRFRDRTIRLVDVGTRTFAFGPVLDRFFSDLGFEPEVHGIEIDAFRRFTNLRSRADYGKYYAKAMGHGYFHAMDFLKFDRHMDVVFMLNPFVTTHSTLRWGLPLKELKPQLLLDHGFKLLNSSKGILITSSPTEEEFELVTHHATKANFEIIQRATWNPSHHSFQKQPRLGAIFQKIQII